MGKINCHSDLEQFLLYDGNLYSKLSHGILKRWKNILVTNPINSQNKTFSYIRSLRYSEYHVNNSWFSGKKSISGFFHTVCTIYYFSRLRRLSYKTGIQIPPNTCGSGLQIWHYGSIIVNEKTRIGKNVTLYPGVVIGHKVAGGPCPVIGDNCFIGAGAKIFGGVTIGNNVTIAPNSVVVSDLPANVVAGGLPAKVIKLKES